MEAWSDPVTTWRHHAGIKIPAGIDTELVLAEGAALLERAAAGVPKKHGREAVLAAVDALRDTGHRAEARLAAALTPAAEAVLARYPLRELVTRAKPLAVRVERERALFGSWYELFPRSEGAKRVPVDPADTSPDAPARLVSGTFRTAAERLPAVAAMGFDVVYLPPIHPIGTTHRKGPNNTLTPGEHDPGCRGRSVRRTAGTTRSTRSWARWRTSTTSCRWRAPCAWRSRWTSRSSARRTTVGQGAPGLVPPPPRRVDRVRREPAEEVPGHLPDRLRQGHARLVAETVRILRFWMDRGVRVFRVDNPHTKPVVFWEKVIEEVNGADPDVIFLAEAFTRPAMMRALGAVGFQQSYTYFTWRNTRHELTEYVTELAGETASFMRPNFFVNTPDILPGYLQEGGRPAFEARAVLAATLSPSWGVYAGFELCENTPAKPGSEEYLNSEKYELRPRDWESAEREGRTLTPLITSLNRIRRRNPALRQLRDVHFHHADNEALIVYSKRSGPNTVLVVVNLDPHHTQEATVSLDMERLGLSRHERVPVRDELTGDTYHWGRSFYVRLEPGVTPAHIAVLRPSPPTGGSPTS